jgi:predicted phosphodiesterase
MNRYGILADIHGNIWALEAVLADAERRNVRSFINLGDTLYGPLEPVATAERLMALDLVSIQGNEDRIIFSDKPASPTLAYVQKMLSSKIRNWLSGHPGTFVLEHDIFLCHGTPCFDTTYLLEKASVQGSVLNDSALIREHLGPLTQQIVLCGHSHIPRTVLLPNGPMIINPGSVGLAAYTDDDPPHIMENGSPHARYAILEKSSKAWIMEHISVPYEWEKAAACAKQNNREDWASWLLTGRA